MRVSHTASSNSSKRDPLMRVIDAAKLAHPIIT